MRTEIVHAPFRPVTNFDWPKNDDLIIQIWSEENLEAKAALIRLTVFITNCVFWNPKWNF